MDLPVIDLQAPNLSALDEALRRCGSFMLLGHGLSPAFTRDVLQHCREFFAQSSLEKNKIRRTAENAWGYFDAELTKNRKDWKEIIDIGPAVKTGPLGGSAPQWPSLAGFRETLEPLSDAMHAIAVTLVEQIAKALESNADLMSPFADHSSFLRLNYYPVCADPAPAYAPLTPTRGKLGISHHTDSGALTVLLADAQPGLQFYHEQRWQTVIPQPGALIINTGDIAQVWSNDRYPAPLHRVLANAHHERFSLPYFLNPAYDYNYAPLPDGLPARTPARYTSINWGEFRSLRSAGDYADHGAEVQISDYAVASNDA